MRNPYVVDPGPDEPLAWQLRAACAGRGDLFFPAVGQHADRARKICAACPVRVECERFAVASGETEGTWGGLSTDELKERRVPRRRRPRRAA